MVIPQMRLEKDDKQIYPEILYFGNNSHDVFKRVWPDGISERLPLEPSLKLVDHSPYGFGWGYAGSSAAQLAAALLLDATLDSRKSLNYYQEFKWEIVAGWGSEWTIFRSDILNWLGLMGARELAARQEKPLI